MHPAFVEALVLGIIGISGVSIGLLLGIRQIAPLFVLALAASTVVRTWSAFAMWSVGRPEWTLEAWLVASVLVSVTAAASHWRHWRPALASIGVFAVASLSALATKYLFDIGERHHSDSASVFALSVVAIQGDIPTTEQIAGSFKRGVTYPLMLALGPEGRILSAYTPLVYLSMLGAAVWLAWTLIGKHVSRRVFIGVVGVVAAFSLTVPMFRAAMFYINGHTLMALALTLLVAGFFLARQQQSFGPVPTAFTVLGGALGATSRIEGIVLVLVVVVALVGQSWWSSTSDRFRLFTALSLTGLSLSWWMSSLNSPALDRLGVSEWLLVPMSLVGAAIAASSWIDPIRQWLLPGLAAGLLLLLARVVWQSADPIGMVLAQWPNLGLGRGGWGTAAHVFIGSAVLLGLRRRSREYRWLLSLSVLIIGAILFSKTFDGGFGREGFYDSVNRMWLHVMPVIITTTLVGYSELIHSLRHRNKNDDFSITSQENQQSRAGN